MIERALVVVAHPDDMEFLAAGTVRGWIEQGAKVSEVIVTNGDKGSLEMDSESLAKARRREAVKAARVLGLEGVEFLGYPDGMLADYPVNEIRRRIMKIIRRLQPDTIVTWDPFAPYEDHPDHRITGRATAEAAAFADMPLYHPEQVSAADSLTPVLKRYYIAKHHNPPTKIVDITGQIEKKLEALSCHKTQLRSTALGLIRSLKAQGADVRGLVAEEENWERLILEAVKAHDAALGKKIGASYGEEFHILEEGPADRLLREALQGRTEE